MYFRENSDNNEADAEGEWMDAHITSHHLSKIHHHQIEEEGVEADESKKFLLVWIYAYMIFITCNAVTRYETSSFT